MRFKATNLLIVLVLIVGGVLTPAVISAQKPAKEPPTTEFAPTPKPTKEEPPDLDSGYRVSTAAWPGPDGFAYGGSTCNYDWLDVAGSGTPIALSDDGYAGPFELGFGFPFYGSMHSQFWISANGFISFDPLTSSHPSNQCPLPSSYSPNNLIALMWDDLAPGDTGVMVYYQSFATCPVGSGRCLVVLYDDVCHYPAGAGCDKAGTFEAILYQNGTILLQFQDTGVEQGSQSTTGIEGGKAAMDFGLSYPCNDPDLSDRLCLQFARLEIPNLRTSEKSAPVVTAAGSLLTYTVSVSNTGLSAATHASLVDPIPANTTLAYTVSPPSLVYDSVEEQIEWTGSLASQDQVDITFAVTVTSECGAQISNTATITDPELPAAVTVQAATTVWDSFYHIEDFEGNNGEYTTEGSTSSWAWGTPRNGPGSAHSGTKAWATGLESDYQNSEYSFLVSPAIDLSGPPRIPDHPLWLEWWDWYRGEACCDYGLVEARGGGSNWTPIPRFYQGNLEGWSRQAVDISQYAGTNDFQFRYRLVSDASVTYEGWYVDDVAIYQCEPPPGLYLGPDHLETSGCVGLEQRHSFHLSNWTGADGTFDLAYSLAEPAWATIEGPNSVPLVDSTGTSFAITLTPEVCLPDQTQVLATLDATGNGHTDTTYLTKTLVTDVIPEWLAVGNAPRGTRFHALAQHDGSLYQIGGETSWWTPTAAVYRYDPGRGIWITVAHLPSARYGMDAVTIGDLVYVPGGSNDTTDTGLGGAFLDELLVYDVLDNLWSSAAPMPQPLAYASAVATDGKLYVIGGQTNDGAYTNSLYIYDPGTDIWSTGTGMSQPRAYAGAAAIGGKIYVAGGFNGPSTVHDTMEIYDPTTDTWEAGPSLPKAWAPFGDAALNDRYLIIFSGDTISYDHGTAYTCSQDAYTYDTWLKRWDALPSLSRCLHGSQGVTTEDGLYALGGRVNSPYWYMASQLEYLQVCPACEDLGWLEGRVYDYNMDAATCTGATVHIEPDGVDMPASASGNYGVPLIPADYGLTARAEHYPGTDGPYSVTVSADGTTNQDFVLARPDIAVDPQTLSAAATAPLSVTQFFTITNRGSYPLTFEITEITKTGAIEALPAQPAVIERDAKAQPVQGSPEIEVEAQLLDELGADESTGYLIYFRQRPDLSPAFDMEWEERGQYVTNALQETASHSQERVRAYLDDQGIAYKAYWIDNVISVRSSNRATVTSLQSFPEIEALRARRQSILYDPVEERLGGASPAAVESNITHVGADRVWSELDVTGEGIIVANIDTGVRYTHEALVNQYRGLQGDGSFDHNHNWWDPALGGSEPEPNDWHSHGSHTMGTMLGDDGDTNQIGMAPGATWIACQGFEFSDDELLECGQFMAAPWDLAGENANPDLRPHVINNSWGDCLQSADYWYDGVIDSWHALGIYPVFSNGNSTNCGYPSPAGCNSLGNPARAGNVTAVGSTGRDNGQYAAHSNWGPTDDPDTVNPNGFPTLKPQVLAPGVSIRSSINNDDVGYGTKNGTSMSAPHVSGLVALMWSAAPCLMGDYATTETMIQDTAVPIPYASDCGGEGPGNVPNMAAGWGEIDAYSAVAAAIEYCHTAQIDWIETDINSGTVAPGQAQPVEVTFTCTPAASEMPQPLEGALRILSNDPCRESLDIPVGFFCSGQNPTALWEKEVWVNGTRTGTVEGPHIIRPGDNVVIVDRVGAVSSESITSTLIEAWDDSLALLDYDTGGVGNISEGEQTLAWTLTGVAPNLLHPITKTFEVLHRDWITGTVNEVYTVQHAVEQLPEVTIHLERYRPAIGLDKYGPFTARDGEIVWITLTILSDDGFEDTAVITDTLPLGMTYSGGLSATHGVAWEVDNTIYWSNYNTAPTLGAPPLTTVGVLSPDTDPLQDLVDLLNGMDGIAAQRITGDLASMTVESLKPHTLIITTNNNRWSDAGANPNIGNILADYVELGGKIIMAGYAWDDPVYGWQLEGRLMAESRTPYQTSTADLSEASLGNFDPLHPVMQGAGSVAAIGTTAHQALPLETGTTWIADWHDGQPCVYAQGTDLLGYNFLLDWSGSEWPWSGDVPVLLENSIRWLVSHAPQPVPPEAQISFKVQVAGQMGQIIRNTARLTWGDDWTSDDHQVIISEIPDLYLPLVLRNE